MLKVVFVVAVMTDITPQELLVWAIWFSVIGFLKIFALLSRKRLDYVSYYYYYYFVVASSKSSLLHTLVR